MQVFKFLAIVALALSSEAKPKRYHGISEKKTPLRELEKLSTDVLPTSYEITLTVTRDDLEKDKKFTGTVAITIFVNKEVNAFKIHAKDLTIKDDISLKPTSGADPGFKISKTDPDANTDFLTITSDKAIPVSIDSTTYTLTINYEGVLSDTEMSGFYRSSYKQGETTKYLATTQFEEMGARKAFPSFDEPAIKAYFHLTINYPDGYNAMSNTPPEANPSNPVNGMRKVTFKQTPLMSTYLVAFIVSEFTCTDGPKVGNLPTQVCSRNATNGLRDLALDTAPKALAAMKTFTSLDYANMGVGKLSQAAIPDFSAGAMENWGMVTYREAILLADDKETSNRDNQNVLTVITHELSHQWFGDYITLDWWSDIFLNEGFATYFEYHASDKIDTASKWDLPRQFVLEQLQAVLLTDSTGNTKPLHYDSTDPDEISSRFDDISYNKGGSILRMIQNLVGDTAFKQGLAAYLDTAPVGIPENLWKSFQNVVPDLPDEKLFTEIMDNWINKAGYPLVIVNSTTDGKNVTISQKQFLLSGEGDTKWYVPISYSTDKAKDFDKTDTKVWLTPEADVTIALDGAKWIVLNNQQTGYYRVSYDKKILDQITNVLKTNLEDIDEISRSQIVDDMFNLARGGKASFPDVLQFIQFLKKEKSYYVWYPTFNGLQYLLQKIGNDEVKTDLNKLIKDIITTFADSVPVGTEKPEDQIHSLSQVLALTWACQVDYGTCVKDTTQRFADYKTNNKEPSGNLKGVVFCNGLRNSKNASDDFDFLWSQYQGGALLSSQGVEILKALGCVKDRKVQTEYLGKALTGDVRLQDVRYVFSSVYSSNPEGVDTLLDFIVSNYTNIDGYFDDNHSTLFSLISTVGSLINTKGQVTKLTDFTNTDGLDTEIKTATDNAIKTANKNLEIVQTLEDSLKNYFNNQNNDNGKGSV